MYFNNKSSTGVVDKNMFAKSKKRFVIHFSSKMILKYSSIYSWKYYLIIIKKKPTLNSIYFWKYDNKGEDKQKVKYNNSFYIIHS